MSFLSLLDFAHKASTNVLEHSQKALQNLSSRMHPPPPPTKQIPLLPPQQNRNKTPFSLSHPTPPTSTHLSSKLQKLKHDRRIIKQNIKKLNTQIRQMTDYDPNSKFHKYIQISEDPEAYDQAYRLLTKMQSQKKEMMEKKIREQKVRQEKIDNERREVEELVRQQVVGEREGRREAIARRMQQERKRHQDLKAIDHMSNSLIKELKRTRNSIFEQKHYGTIDIGNTSKVIVSRKHSKDVEQKDKSKSPQSLSPTKLHKSKFSYLIEQQQKQRKNEIKAREHRKYSQLERRKKYGQLVTTLLPKPSQRPSNTAGTATPKKSSVQTINQQKVTQKQRRRTVTETAAQGSFTKVELQRFDREKELRRKTNQRIKQLQMMDEELNKVERPFTNKYKNYLRYHPRGKNFDEKQTKKILENNSLTSEQKYNEIVNRASLLQHKAKIREENNAGNEEVLGCIVASIQAKLALLGTL